MTDTTTIDYDVRTMDFSIHIYQGEDWSLTIQCLDENGGAYSFASYTAKAQVRDTEGGTLLADLTVTFGTGTITLSLTAAQTEVLNFSEGRYDLLVKSGASIVTPFLKGLCIVTRKVGEWV